MRLFVAIALPEEVSAALRRCRQELPRLRWTRPGQLHLTLGFIADLPDERLPDLQDALGRVRRSAFAITIGECGWFPSTRRPRIGWLGMVNTPELAALKSDIDHCLQAVDVPLENRPFVPHLTLLRLPPGSNLPQELALVLARHCTPLAGQKCEVMDFRLMASELHPSGAIHQQVALFHLGQR